MRSDNANNSFNPYHVNRHDKNRHDCYIYSLSDSQLSEYKQYKKQVQQVFRLCRIKIKYYYYYYKSKDTFS